MGIQTLHYVCAGTYGTGEQAFIVRAWLFKRLLYAHFPDIKYVSGSVEAACGLGLADGVVDLVETGTTMRVGGLLVELRPGLTQRIGRAGDLSTCDLLFFSPRVQLTFLV